MKSCLFSIFQFIGSLVCAAATLKWMVTQWQATHQVPLVGIGLLCVWAVLFVIAMFRMDHATRTLIGARDRTEPAILEATPPDEREVRR